MLFRQGEADGAAYILKSGAIGLYRESQGRRVSIATVRPGEMFGEILPIVPAGINVGFVRNVARAENFVEGCSAGFKAEIVVIAAIKINF